MQIAILGAGSFGTVLADQAATNGHQVHLWTRDAEVASAINRDRVNAKYHPTLKLHASIHAYTELAEAVADAELVLLSVPSKVMGEVCQQLAPIVPANASLVSTTKGIERDGFLLMSQVIHRNLPAHAIGVLSGPNIAKELAERHLTASVIASANPLVRERTRQALATKYFRLYSSNDLISVELGGALKNIYAIAAGLADGLGVGDNTKALLITRALAEMSRLSAHMGGNPLTFLGLAGVGDLYVTSVSPHSRNFRIGRALADGQSLETAEAALGQVAEGINTLSLVHAQTASWGVAMPILDALHQVIFGGKPVRQMALQMMQAAHTSDVEFLMPTGSVSAL
ncbi:MAG: NAD(P)-dependent glycerol-3-phosphate dehydrogenase [Gammaproteobacteria bacterium]|nr:NAD(P)-dependent glycerol-3-phosphate dehydrogenase [Gammaproteobacteria bacterium]